MDLLTKEKRSWNMSRIKGKDTQPELAIRKALYRKGYRYRIHNKVLPGKPDLVLKKYRAVIFIDGCFWHAHNCHLFKWPKTRQEFWQKKISGNKQRDQRNRTELKKQEWRILTIRECSLKGKTRLTIEKVIHLTSEWLESNDSDYEITGGLVCQKTP